MCARKPTAQLVREIHRATRAAHRGAAPAGRAARSRLHRRADQRGRPRRPCAHRQGAQARQFPALRLRARRRHRHPRRGPAGFALPAQPGCCGRGGGDAGSDRRRRRSREPLASCRLHGHRRPGARTARGPSLPGGGLPGGDDPRHRRAGPGGRELPRPQGELPDRMGSGSGFFIEGGYIVTNNHVVDDAKKVTVRMADGKEIDATVGRHRSPKPISPSSRSIRNMRRLP